MPPLKIYALANPLEVGGQREIGLPARGFQMADGSIKCDLIIEFTTKRALPNFRRSALRAVETHLCVIPA